MKKVNFVYWGVVALGILIALNFVTGRHNISWLIAGLVIAAIGLLNLILCISKNHREKIRTDLKDERVELIERASKSLFYDICFILLNFGIVVGVFINTEMVLILLGLLILQTVIYYFSRIYYSGKF
ncbi:MAG: hypothetical protein Q8920_16325 [Bacillota bacterium]|nr:hypothetical protein [Bacillota bacterium]